MFVNVSKAVVVTVLRVKAKGHMGVGEEVGVTYNRARVSSFPWIVTFKPHNQTRRVLVTRIQLRA